MQNILLKKTVKYSLIDKIIPIFFIVFPLIILIFFIMSHFDKTTLVYITYGLLFYILSFSIFTFFLYKNKKKYEDFRLNEYHYKNFFDNSLVGVYRSRLSDGLFLEVNKTLADIIGLKHDQIINKVSSIDLYQDIEQRNKVIKILKEHGEVRYIEIDFVRFDGTKKRMALTAKVSLEFNIVDGTVLDITDQMETRKSLEESKKHYKNFFDNSLVGIFRSSLNDMSFLDVNQTTANVLGYSVDELKHQIKTPELYQDIKQREAFIKELKEKGEIRYVELDFIRPDGDKRRVALTAKLFPEDGVMEGTALDITSVTNTRKALKDSEEYNRTLFHDSHIPLVVMRSDNFQFTDCNDAAVKIYGYNTIEEVLGKTPVDVSAKVQYDNKSSEVAAKDYINQALEDGSVLFEWKHQRPGGEFWDGEVQLMAISINGERMLQFSLLDITDRKRSQELLIQSEKMISVGGLAAGMAHEINNPLAGMLQTAQNIENRLTNSKLKSNIKVAAKIGISIDDISEYMKNREIFEMIKTLKLSGDRIAKIVLNMLNFSRKSESMFEKYDMALLMDKTLELAATDYNLKKHYDFKSIKIIKEYDKNLPAVLCDANKLQQVFLNIISNGAQAMGDFFEDSDDKKTACFIFRLSENSVNKTLKIEIEDNGSGIPNEIRTKIFEPFFTTKPVGIGTGLGLSVSYFIITNDHKGTMRVESEVDKGTTFIIELPIDCDVTN